MMVQYANRCGPRTHQKNHVPLEVHAQVKKDNLEATKRLHEDLMQAQEQFEKTMMKIAQDHNKSFEFIVEQLHLGGHAIKQCCSPGINNTYCMHSALPVLKMSVSDFHKS